VGAGLGGGSSDAAATLTGLNRMWDLALPMEELAGLAARLGSDVPFALWGGTALGRGRGEVLEPLATPPFWFVLARPPFAVATVRAYALYRPAGEQTPAVESFLAAPASRDPVRVAPLLRNDLEVGVYREWPELARLREQLLEAGALGARMTGSGSVVFGLARDEPHARRIAERLERSGRELWVRVVRAIPAER
jgi:4-diphosphocytidyl-2-C-methyl-D-erythritol kinase